LSDFLQNHQKLATVAVILIALAVVVFLILISGGNTPPASKTVTTPVVAHGVRQVNYGELLAADLTDGKTLDEAIFFDINGDGVEEALLVAHGPGDSQPVDWYLFGARDGRAIKLFERTRVAKGEIRVQGPMLVESEGVYGAGDSECCPSSLKQTYYVWKGDGLVVPRVEAAPATAGP